MAVADRPAQGRLIKGQKGNAYQHYAHLDKSGYEPVLFFTVFLRFSNKKPWMLFASMTDFTWEISLRK